MTKLTILGPNGISDSTFHVHRAGCRDIARYRNPGVPTEAWTGDFANHKGLIIDLFSDFFWDHGYTDDEGYDEYKQHARMFPCVSWEGEG